MSAYNPSKLHPGGYGAVPIALMCDQRSGKNHVAAYAAVVSAVVGKGAAAGTTGRNLTRNARLLERSGLSWHTFMEAVRDLEEWGYLERLPTPPRSPKRWRILPTPDVTSDLEAEAEADAAALDPTTTGREGGKKAQGSRGGRVTLEAENDPKALAATAIGTRDHRDRNSRPPRDSLDGSLDGSLDIWCAGAHQRLSDLEKAKKLAKAVGTKYALDALEHTSFMLRSGEEIEHPWQYARSIANCYKLKCTDAAEHGDLHGYRRRDYHRGVRADASAEERAVAARDRRQSPPEWSTRPEVVETLQRHDAAMEDILASVTDDLASLPDDLMEDPKRIAS